MKIHFVYLLLLVTTFCRAQLCFNAVGTSSTDYQPYDLVRSDFNNDGNIDVATGNFNSVNIFLGNGTGSFNTSATYSIGPTVYSMIAADFNNDGNSDLAAVGGQNKLGIILGSGTGAFGAPASYTLGSVASPPTSIVSADFNNDGNADLAVASGLSASGTKKVTILLGTGTGNFSLPSSFTLNPGPFALAAADLNADGFTDLACANGISDNASILLGTGTGSFGTASTFSVMSNPIFILSADFNQDGKADLATCNQGSGNVSVLMGTGTGSVTSVTNFSVGNTPISISADDLNNDGKPDLCAAVNAWNSASLSVIVGDGTGNFASAVTVTTGVKPSRVLTGDLNADGRSDLAVLDYSAGTFTSLLNCISTGLEEEKQGDRLKIYPNPARNNFIIQGLEKETATVSIYNLEGRLIHTGEAQDKTSVSLKNVGGGLYLLVIRSDAQWFTGKLLVED